MPLSLEIKFVPLTATLQATTVILCGAETRLGQTSLSLDNQAAHTLTRAAAAAGFSGRAKASIECLAPPKLDTKRIIMVGTGGKAEEQARLNFGGVVLAAIISRKTETK